ncbi:hypothetical protein Bbelb_249250 [Branchiostoma belcheri]|nr:hypothetical protein Bbelb_249250 [Branchiostoma belcheri]
MWGEESCVEGSDSVCSTGKSSVATSDCNSVAEALIGKHGGILMLPNAATSLLFSPHSISNQINITLEILHNPVVLPELREDETLVSPFVFCGPHGWTFHKPVLLTFPHCGMSDRDDFTLLVTETSSQQAPDWVEVSSDTPGIEYFVRDSECLVYTSHFTGFSLKSKGPKQVRLLAFSSVSDHLYRLRVYCISDTKDVVDRIKKEEQEFGFKQTDRGVSMTFLKNKKDLHLRAHLETPGWKFLNSSELVISYESVRRKRDSNVLFKLQAEPEHKKGTAILSLSICAFQDGNSDSPTYSIAEELPVAPGQTEMQKLGPTSCDHKGACNCKTPSQILIKGLFQTAIQEQGSKTLHSTCLVESLSLLMNAFPSIMRKCVWLLVLFPWLVQCQLGQSTIRSPTTDAGFIATKEPDSEVVVESSDTDGLSPESSERESTPSLASDQYGPCGESVPSHDLCQGVTEPKPTQAVEIERTRDLALNITGSDNDEPGHFEAEEVNGSSAAHSAMPQDDQESTAKFIIVTIIPEVEHFPQVYYETTV